MFAKFETERTPSLRATLSGIVSPCTPAVALSGFTVYCSLMTDFCLFASPIRPNYPQLRCFGDSFCPVGCFELFQDMTDMRFNRIF